MANDTMLKFNYPQSLVCEYDHWVVLLRPAQVTPGSLVLAAKADAERFPDLPPEAFAELKKASADLEGALGAVFRHDKINYLMLMMVDPHVHYHVIPRYAAAVALEGREHADADWPGPPDVTRRLDLSDDEMSSLQAALKARWPA